MIDTLTPILPSEALKINKRRFLKSPIYSKELA